MRSAVIEPLYLRVGHGDQKLRLTAARHADRRQLVRVWAAEHRSKMSRIPEFKQFELEPADGQALARDISALNRIYWLAISVFSNDGTQWLRSIPTRLGPIDVPQTELGFVDAALGGIWETQFCRPSIVLSVVYL